MTAIHVLNGPNHDHFGRREPGIRGNARPTDIGGGLLAAAETRPSNVHARGAFAHVSPVAPVCAGVICGFGPMGDGLGLDAPARLMAGRTDTTQP